MNPAKVIAAKKLAGEIAFRLIQETEGEIHNGRRSMHDSYIKFGRKIWMHDYDYTKYQIERLRAVRLFYDKLPAYAR